MEDHTSQGEFEVLGTPVPKRNLGWRHWFRCRVTADSARKVSRYYSDIRSVQCIECGAWIPDFRARDRAKDKQELLEHMGFARRKKGARR